MGKVNFISWSRNPVLEWSGVEWSGLSYQILTLLPSRLVLHQDATSGCEFHWDLKFEEYGWTNICLHTCMHALHLEEIKMFQHGPSIHLILRKHNVTSIKYLNSNNLWQYRLQEMQSIDIYETSFNIFFLRTITFPK